MIKLNSFHAPFGWDKILKSYILQAIFEKLITEQLLEARQSTVENK